MTDSKPLPIYLKFSITLFIACIITGFLFIVILLWFLLLVLFSLRPPTSWTWETKDFSTVACNHHTHGKPMTTYVRYFWHHMTMTGIKELRKAKHSSHLTTFCIKQDLQMIRNHINMRNKAVVDTPQDTRALSKQNWSRYSNCKGAFISKCKNHGTFNSH